MTNFVEEELRKLFGNGEVIENPVFLGNVCTGTPDCDLRVRTEFVAAGEKDGYDALLIRVIHRGGEIDRLTLRFLDVWGKRSYRRNPQTVEDTEPRVVAFANRADWVGTPDDEDRRILREEGVKLPDGAEKFTDMEAPGRICKKKFPGQFVGDCYVFRPESVMPELYSARNPESLGDGWNIRVKLASESCPEGAWIHLPDYNFVEDALTGEIGIALRRLGAEEIGECRILDAQCDVPGLGDIPAQYDSVEALLYGANNMGFLLEERFQGAPDFQEQFAAAPEYENCATLADAVSIGDDADSYEVVKVENLRALPKSGWRTAAFPRKYARPSIWRSMESRTLN